MGKLAIACFLATAACAAWPGEVVWNWDKVFREGVIDAAGEPGDIPSFKGKFIGLYFAEGTSAACKALTPKLIAFRDKYGAMFEMVFISTDQSAEDMMQHMKDAKMPWLALPWRCKSADKLKREYQIGKVPKVLIFSMHGKLLTKEGIEDLTKNPHEAFGKWYVIIQMLKDQQ